MKKNILIDLFNQSIYKKKIISIYSDKEFLDNFLVGYVQKYENNFVLMKNIDKNGDFDGFSILLQENIYLIEFNDEYLNKLNQLLTKTILPIEVEHLKIIEKIKDISFDKIIEFSKNNKIILSINLSLDREINGYVTDFDENYIITQNFNEYGIKDGFSLFNLFDIERINIFSKELQRMNKLMSDN